MRFAKVTVLGFVAFVALACTGVSIPSIPSIPPIPSFSIPSGGLPSGLFPSGDANSGACLLVTPAEVSSIMGGQATVTDSSSDSCSYLIGFTSVVVTIANETDLQGSKVIFGASAKDITVAGLPAVSGVFIGQPAVYVQKGATQLQVLGILTGSDDATLAKIVQIATTAVGRLP